MLAEYVWIGGGETTGGFDLRSKTKVLDSKPASASDLPDWNYDGSSTSQAPGADSEVILKPQALFACPFRGGDNVIVMCDTYAAATGEPLPTNTRKACNDQMEKVKDHEPWFGIEQEYTLYEPDGTTPLGWPKNGFPRPQGPFYCSAGFDCSYGRAVADAHMKACLHAGIKLSGLNGEVMPGQWEYQVGPCLGIEEGDHLWMSRYIMIRICEIFGVNVTFHPKPMKGDWNGAGCHCNYSTKSMRAPGGLKVIEEALAKLEVKHQEHIDVYGAGNDERLTGAHETAPITKFSFGVANRGASCRIPRTTDANGCGYFEDRRPASNVDPYLLTGKMVQTTILD